MSDRTIEERVKQILSENLCVNEDFIQDHHSLIDDLGGDSLDLVEIVMELEDEFGMHIPDELAEKFNTVQDIINYVIENI